MLASEEDWPPDDVAEVRVVDADGKPVAGARVFLLREPLTGNDGPAEVRGEAVAGEEGRARLPVAPGEWYMVRVEHPDYAVTGDVECFGGNRAEIVLTKGGSLVGVVTDAKTGEPVASATVVGLDW